MPVFSIHLNLIGRGLLLQDTCRFESLNRHHFLVCNDILQHLQPPRPKTAKIESPPQTRHWRSNKTVAEGDSSSTIAENHSQLEVIATGVRQFPETLEVTGIHSSAGLDFDTDQGTTPSFNHKVNLVLVLIPVVIQSAGWKPRLIRINVASISGYRLV